MQKFLIKKLLPQLYSQLKVTYTPGRRGNSRVLSAAGDAEGELTRQALQRSRQKKARELITPGHFRNDSLTALQTTP